MFAENMLNVLGHGIIGALKAMTKASKKQAGPAQLLYISKLCPPEMKGSIPAKMTRGEATAIMHKLIRYKMFNAK